MARARAAAEKSKATRLDAAAWIAAAFDALADGGIDAVRVEPLAKALGITKGSFYWHFADRRALLDAMLRHFEDPALGGFFFTSDDHEALIHRSKSFSDDAIPAGNGVAARALIRAGYLLGEPRYLEAAERTLRAAWLAMNRFPHGHMSLLAALDEYLAPPEIIVIRTQPGDEGWQQELGKLYAPRRMVFSIPAALDGLDAAIADKSPGAHTRAYVCRGSTCSAPIETLSDLVRHAQARL